MSDDMIEARAEYGDVYSKEKCQAFYDKTLYHPDLIDIKKGEPNCFEINNNDWESNTAIRELNEIAGLDWVEPDTKAIA